MKEEKMKILIFERVLATKQSLENQVKLIDEKIELVTADNINLVLYLLREYYFDLIVIDMDNLNGQFRLLKKLAFEKNPDVTLIMLTLYPYKNIIDKFLKEGVDYCFDKVVELDKFLTTVAETIKNTEPELDSNNSVSNVS